MTPAFVEFDMSAEGFGCLYLPSIAPQSTPSQTVVNVGMATTTDSANISGVGTGNVDILSSVLVFLNHLEKRTIRAAQLHVVIQCNYRRYE